jgi:hypothetical protein
MPGLLDPAQYPRPLNGASCASIGGMRSIPMMDLVVLALGLALFALAIGYGYACERL